VAGLVEQLHGHEPCRPSHGCMITRPFCAVLGRASSFETALVATAIAVCLPDRASSKPVSIELGVCLGLLKSFFARCRTGCPTYAGRHLASTLG